ncbi:MAG: hypothetical protein ABS69_20790 [Nitrosomonadales bacterium SCN 54-20]|nr:MAG: hypothetical protein ABS69_20790 [Nitrosomonadales bacterium SCN 54-20]
MEILRDGGEIYYYVISPVSSPYADQVTSGNLGATGGRWPKKTENPPICETKILRTPSGPLVGLMRRFPYNALFSTRYFEVQNG